MTKHRTPLDRSVAFSILLEVLPGYADSPDDGGATVTRCIKAWMADSSTNMHEFIVRWVAGGCRPAPHTAVLASGRLAHVAGDGTVEMATCGELVDLGLAPEPTSADDRVIVPCGAPMRALTGWGEVGAWACDAGHSFLGLEAELGPGGREWEREQADRAAA